MVIYDYGITGKVFSRRRKKRKLTKTKFLSYLAVFGLVGVVVMFVLGISLFVWYGKDLPQPDKVRNFDGLSTIIYSRDGEPIYDIYADQNIIPVKLKEIPKDIINATIAIEDQSFYDHSGFSIRGTLRAAIRTLFFGKLEGGSTLTQQLVKNALLTNERSLPRKVKELMLSLQIERRYSKDEILEMYLNNVPYGGTAWGVKTASETYFDKDVSELNLVESAILAGLPQAPTTYSPFGPNPTAYITRTKGVLRRMREDKYITKKEEEEAVRKLDKVVFSGSADSFRAAHFVMYVRGQLVDMFDEALVERGGLRVTTTLDISLQDEAEKIVKEEVDKSSGLKVSNGAAIVMDPNTGEILAMVGSKDYGEEEEDFQGKFNIVTQGVRQPGSSIKPITYATAFQKGYTPATMFVDAPTEYPGGDLDGPYKPENYDGKYRGPIQLRFGLANSINVIAVKTLALVGVEDMLENAYNMGLTTLEPTKENVRRVGLSITLGGGEVKLIDMAVAYGVFANGGKRREPVSILKVENVDGDVLFEQKESDGEDVLESGVAYLISDILSDNSARSEIFGSNSYLNIAGNKVAAKTGTTNDLRDNWTLGYTKDAVVGVWVGNNDNSPMDSRLASGVTGAAPIWHSLMRVVLRDRSDGFVKRPENIISVEVDKIGGGLPVEGISSRTELFIKGTEPQDKSNIYQRLKISRADPSKLANKIEIAKGEYDEKDFIVLKEDDPLSEADGINKWQKGIDEWLQTVEDQRYHVPNEEYNGSEEKLVVRIKSLDNEKRYEENKIRVKAEAVSDKEITKMEIFVNGNLRESERNKTIDKEIELEKGAYTIKVRAEDSNGNAAEDQKKIGIQVAWDYKEEPDPTQTPVLSPTP